MRYTPEQLAVVLAAHEKWRLCQEGGERANLLGADLRSANLRCANLLGADLSGANLLGANLRDANLLGANLRDADLRSADLRCAHLSGADLHSADLRCADLRCADLGGADLRCAHLSGADLRCADLGGADLRCADLGGADLRGVENADLALAMVTHLPGGQFDAWKKCRDGVLAHLRIPEKARRSHGAERKCRAEFALVLGVYGPDGKKVAKGLSIYSDAEPIEYIKGRHVYPDGWDENRWNICGQGIHFFLTKLEAEAFVM